MQSGDWFAALIPPARRGGRRRSVDVREVLNAILYVLLSGLPMEDDAERYSAQEHGPFLFS